MTRRSVDTFKAHHDPRTIVTRLEKELADTRDKLSTQETIKNLLDAHLGEARKFVPPRWLSENPKDEKAPGVPTLFLSDIHAGEVVKASEVNGINRYDLDLMHSRMEHTVKTARYLFTLLKGHEQAPGIVVALGGDMVSGDIHDELKVTNALPTIPTVLDLYETISTVLHFCAEEFGKVFVPCVSGNHGRNTMKTWNKLRNHTSFDWMLYQMLLRGFAKDPRVDFFIPDGSDALYRVYGTRYLLTHGDQFRSADSIIGPVGPLMRGNQKKTARNLGVGQPYDIMMCGHWHRYMHLPNLIVNSTMKGYDEYAYANNYLAEPPQQAFWTTHERFGVNWAMPVRCELPPKTKAAAWVSRFDGAVD